MELITLGIFCGVLLICIISGVNIVYGLLFSLFLFLGYGLKKGYKLKELLLSCLSGVKTIRNVLLMLVLVGMLTALWRAAGTVPTIVSYASGLIKPSVFLLATFLLNCLMSFLTGTAFGTAATMGVICGTIGNALGVHAMLTGGAMLSGVFFGDRCSPVSTSMMLVAELTKTDGYRNIHNMLRTALLPFALSCALYFIAGTRISTDGNIPLLSEMFSKEFTLSFYALIPALLLLSLALFRVNMKLTLAAGIVSAIPVWMLLQGGSFAALPRLLWCGYIAQNAELSTMLSGGGISSMIKVILIIGISSAFSGIFSLTGLLNSIQSKIDALVKHTTPFVATLCTAILASMLACNQTLSIILTHQLAGNAAKDPYETAINMEDTVVVVAPMIPWSIAGGVPLASAGAPTAGILCAWYLFLIPLCRLLPFNKIKSKG